MSWDFGRKNGQASRAGDTDEEFAGTWQKQVTEDMHTFGAELVTQAMVDTAEAVEDRRYSKQATALMKWHGIAFWALPRALALDPTELRMIDGMYHRAWVCEVDGAVIDGHMYVKDQGSCVVCGY